jgi:hypothetical protein
MPEQTELTTSEAAAKIGVPVDALRKWKYRGLLKRAPQGVAGQGRSVECLWSSDAIEEARQVAASRKPGPPRKHFDR